MKSKFECVEKIKTINDTDGRLRLIYMWVKQDLITLSIFKELIEYTK